MPEGRHDLLRIFATLPGGMSGSMGARDVSGRRSTCAMAFSSSAFVRPPLTLADGMVLLAPAAFSTAFAAWPPLLGVLRGLPAAASSRHAEAGLPVVLHMLKVESAVEPINGARDTTFFPAPLVDVSTLNFPKPALATPKLRPHVGVATTASELPASVQRVDAPPCAGAVANLSGSRRRFGLAPSAPPRGSRSLSPVAAA
mmetsp:Transcript_88993/g.256568  ORF Transcript_88993/g.256568 Transcript_88993/m.256568 type:complete len:200 (-) Transcript_88993:276-875(-)